MKNRDCPVCNGDCAGANPPMIYCPIRDGDPAASADTHPKGGDVQQAPAPLSGAVPEGQTPNSSSYSSSPPKEQR